MAWVPSVARAGREFPGVRGQRVLIPESVQDRGHTETDRGDQAAQGDPSRASAWTLQVRAAWR